MFNIIIQIISLLSFSYQTTNTYNIVEVYQAQTPPNGTVVLTSFNEIKDVELLLFPAEVKFGKYNVAVTRKRKDLYKIDGYDLYIKTSYCNEYSVSAKATIKYSNNIGLNKGEITFLK